MKKCVLILVLCLSLLPMSAFANGWGLPDGLTHLVTETHDYDEYHDQTDDYSRKYDTARVIMTSRYHNQLIAAEKTASGDWEGMTYTTTAVYQPSEQAKYGFPKLTRTEGGFELSYPEAEELYRFVLTRGDEEEAIYTLTYAKMGDVTVERQAAYRYLVTLGAARALWVQEVTLDTFNIHQMPHRGPEDVRRMNEAQRGLQELAFLEPRLVSGQTGGKRSYAVYAAPDAATYRAAKGKAAVSTGDDYRLYCTVGDWSLIEYRVSMRTSRIGWAQMGNHGDETTEEIVRVPVRTAFDTYLTDDPNVSEYPQALLPTGTKLTALSHLADNWAYLYVEATVDGKRMRGFVPQRDVVFDDVVLPDEEAKCVGSWEMEGGGEIWYAYLQLEADGRFYASDAEDCLMDSGTWNVVQTAEKNNLYWLEENIPTIVLRCEDGRVLRYGVCVNETAVEDGNCLQMSFLSREGGVGYVPYGARDENGNPQDKTLHLKDLPRETIENWETEENFANG